MSDEKDLSWITELKPGDIITHTRCGGSYEEHHYTGKDGYWLRGLATNLTAALLFLDENDLADGYGAVNDISPKNVTHINRERVDVFKILDRNYKKRLNAEAAKAYKNIIITATKKAAQKGQ